MRKITSREKSHGMRYCTFCKPARVEADWRNQYRTIDMPIQLACEVHKHLIEDGPLRPTPPNTAEVYCDDGHMTEADYQTWWRV